MEISQVASMQTMKAYGLVDVWRHWFLPPALHGDEWSTSRPGHFAPVPSPAGNQPTILWSSNSSLITISTALFRLMSRTRASIFCLMI